jgi:hypothetical protein
MIEHRKVQAAESDRPQSLFWSVSALGLIAVFLAIAALRLEHRFGSLAHAPVVWLVGRISLLAMGLLCAAWTVMARPWSAPGLSSAAATAAIASLGVDAEWDTLRLLLRVAAAVGAVTAVVMMLPSWMRRLAVSLLIVVHFGGILTAVTSVPPPGAPAPWLATQLWTHFYRPYLQFVYLNNAYHFYSPEPGPAVLLWFHIEYADGSSHWLKVPDYQRDFKDPMLFEYYRRLPIAQNVNQVAPVQNVSPESLRSRTIAGAWLGLPSPEELTVYLPGVPQYQPPGGNAPRLLESYARYVAKTAPAVDTTSGVRGVKVYRVVHAIVQPGPYAQGMDPRDHTLYLPYFQGEYDSEGRLKDSQDPLLYWLIPILNGAPREQAALDKTDGSEAQAGGGRHLLDYLHAHAGSSPWEEAE